MAKGKSNQIEGDDLRTRYRKGPWRQFTPKLPVREARALIWLSITLELSLTDTVGHLVRQELIRCGMDIDGPAFDPPVAARAHEQVAA